MGGIISTSKRRAKHGKAGEEPGGHITKEETMSE